MLEEGKESSELIRQRVFETYFKRNTDKPDTLIANSVLVDMEPKVV